jgi:predicted NBD/HSP70 family sugar kinase
MVRRVAAVRGLADRLGLTLEAEHTDSEHAAVLGAAISGDREVIETLAPAFEQLGSAVASLVNVLDVGQVIIGGPAVVNGPDLYLDPIRAALANKPIARQVQAIGVRQSGLGDQGAVVGAAAMIFQENYGPNLVTSEEGDLNA